MISLCKNSRHSELLYLQWLNQENLERHWHCGWDWWNPSMSALNLINSCNRSNNNTSHMYCIAPFMKDLQACCEHSRIEHHCPSPWSGSPLPAAENTFSWETLGRGSYRCIPGSRQMCVCVPAACSCAGHMVGFTFLFRSRDILLSHFLRSLCHESGLLSTISFIFSKINISICLHLVSLCSSKFSVVPLSWYSFRIFNCVTDTFMLLKPCFASLVQFAGETVKPRVLEHPF